MRKWLLGAWLTCGVGLLVVTTACGSDDGSPDADAGDSGGRDTDVTDTGGPGDTGSDGNLPDTSVADSGTPSCMLDCVAPSFCVEADGMTRCDCPSGYTLGADERSCDDVDECAAGTDDCGGRACRNTPGAFDCECAPGEYWEDGACRSYGQTTMTAGDTNVAEVRSDGAMWSWGHNRRRSANLADDVVRVSRPTRAGDSSEWRSASLGGSDYGCGVRSDDSLWCWGRHPGISGTIVGVVEEQVDDTISWGSVSAGAEHACALSDTGALHCWGRPGLSRERLGDPTLAVVTTTPTAITPAERYAVVSAGAFHSCALRTDGTLWCWGQNVSGELGLGDFVLRDVPTQVPGASDWRTVAIATSGTCGIRAGGQLWCWGRGAGNGSSPSVEVPLQIGSDDDWREIAMSRSATCATKTNRSLWCWGISPALGHFAEMGRTPTQIGTGYDWREITFSEEGTLCGRRADGVHCFGANLHGELGRGFFGNDATPTRVGTDTWRDVAVGQTACGVKMDGSLWCWSHKRTAPAGRTDPRYRQSPERIGTDADWAGVSSGIGVICALKESGALYCWGSNGLGQAGTGRGSPTSPTQVGLETDWVDVASTTNHTCGIRASDELWCWGQGARVDGTTDTSFEPVLVSSGWSDIDGGPSFTAMCGVRSGVASCWGASASFTIQEHATSSTWLAVSPDLFGNGGCGLFGGGDLACWSPPSPTATPVSLGPPDDFVSVEMTSPGAACMLRASGEHWCYGPDVMRQVIERESPGGSFVLEERGEGIRWTRVDTFGSAFCGIRESDGALFCWGFNAFGGLGNGRAWDMSPAPVL